MWIVDRGSLYDVMILFDQQLLRTRTTDEGMDRPQLFRCNNLTWVECLAVNYINLDVAVADDVELTRHVPYHNVPHRVTCK